MNFKHGRCVGRSKPRPRIKRIWASMVSRTRNRGKHRDRYIAKGIKVCDRWRVFANFHQDVGDPPSDKHSLDRWPNKDGDYEPGNVRWATRAEQARNTSRTRMFTLEDETLCMADWSDRYGVDRRVVHKRLGRGWTIEEALNLVARG